MYFILVQQSNTTIRKDDLRPQEQLSPAKNQRKTDYPLTHRIAYNNRKGRPKTYNKNITKEGITYGINKKSDQTTRLTL
jgi:hypothetical protein